MHHFCETRLRKIDKQDYFSVFWILNEFFFVGQESVSSFQDTGYQTTSLQNSTNFTALGNGSNVPSTSGFVGSDTGYQTTSLQNTTNNFTASGNGSNIPSTNGSVGSFSKFTTNMCGKLLKIAPSNDFHVEEESSSNCNENVLSSFSSQHSRGNTSFNLHGVKTSNNEDLTTSLSSHHASVNSSNVQDNFTSSNVPDNFTSSNVPDNFTSSNAQDNFASSNV